MAFVYVEPDIGQPGAKGELSVTDVQAITVGSVAV